MMNFFIRKPHFKKTMVENVLEISCLSKSYNFNFEYKSKSYRDSLKMSKRSTQVGIRKIDEAFR